MASKKQIEEAIEDKKPFKQQSPDRIINRFLIMQHIHRTHTPDQCEQMVPGTAAVEELFNEEGEKELFFNWEFILFQMPLAELEFMAERLFYQAQLEKKKAEIVGGIMEAQTQDEVDKRKIQGLTLTMDEIMDIKIQAANPEINPVAQMKAHVGGLLDKDGNPL